VVRSRAASTADHSDSGSRAPGSTQACPTIATGSKGLTVTIGRSLRERRGRALAGAGDVHLDVPQLGEEAPRRGHE